MRKERAYGRQGEDLLLERLLLGVAGPGRQDALAVPALAFDERFLLAIELRHQRLQKTKKRIKKWPSNLNLFIVV